MYQLGCTNSFVSKLPLISESVVSVYGYSAFYVISVQKNPSAQHPKSA